jgi:hypothetical protein
MRRELTDGQSLPVALGIPLVRNGGKLMRFIGDVHGKIEGYLALLDADSMSFQVGDMGLGFGVTLPKQKEDDVFIPSWMS